MRVFIENEAGSRQKNTYDEATRVLLGTVEVSCAYPFPYGFVLDTRSGDGDAVDCFVLTSRPLRSGTAVTCEPVALLEHIEDGEIDHKVLAVLPGEPVRADEAVVARLTAFNTNVFAHIPDKHTHAGPLRDAAAAREYVRQCTTAARTSP